MIFFDAEERVRMNNKKKERELTIVSWFDEDYGEMETVEREDIEDFIIIAQDTDIICGFNCFAFDYTLFEFTEWPVTQANEKTLDFYDFLRNQVTNDRPFNVPGLSLNALSIVNLGDRKIDLKGTPAKLWESGSPDARELVIAYNQKDVFLLRELFWKAYNEEELLYEPDIPEEELDEGMGIPIDCSELLNLHDYLQSQFYEHVVGW
ncbi:TPA_asm: hypothetical protein vir520_00065 [Caudoviricetes sp. vir520]|nr:TPA_asm: hypothetical protein vir520_00065 [Caudoviricetes sp. vir520]